MDSAIEMRREHSVEDVLRFVRPAVRSQKPYVVGGVRDLPVKLNQNENPYDLPPALKRELVDAFMEIPFNRYPSEHPDRLRDALAQRLGRDPAGILVGNGSNELSYLLGLVLVERGTPVVLPRPMFSLYEKVIRLYGGALTEVAPLPDLRFDVAAIRDAVRSTSPALTVIASPNNPTGLAVPLADLESIVREARGFVVVDEAYEEFNPEESAVTILDRYPNLIVMRTFSKAAGLAGLRVGYLVGWPEVIREFGKARLPFNVDQLAETAALFLLERPELMAERVRAVQESLRELVAGLGQLKDVTVVPTQANFVIFKTTLEPGVLMSRLAQAGVLVRDMSGYPDLKGYVRVSAGTPGENRAFLLALNQALHASPGT
ncbi:MAG TPA: histidinol-phosphate transaminase [Rhodothermales bacterium]|nr:histidinol-phosphate transaminase [Rhodothermales bacterium]